MQHLVDQKILMKSRQTKMIHLLQDLWMVTNNLICRKKLTELYTIVLVEVVLF